MGHYAELYFGKPVKVVAGTRSERRTKIIWLLVTAAAPACNLAFIAYGYLADLMPVLVLHAVLLPVNAYRLLQLCWVELRPKHASHKQRRPTSFG